MSYSINFFLLSIAEKNVKDFYLFYIMSHSNLGSVEKVLKLRVRDLEKVLIPKDTQGLINYFSRDLGFSPSDFVFRGYRGKSLGYRQAIRRWKSHNPEISLRQLSRLKLSE